MKKMLPQNNGMDEATLKLKNPPIVEAVLNIECVMRPNMDLAALQEPAKKAFLPQYPKFKAVYMQEHRVEVQQVEEPQVSTKKSLYGLQFIQEDEKQLVQIRPHGFSFNRLAPYTTLDDYFNSIEQAWAIFVKLTSPIQNRFIQLRYINRILLPLPQGDLDLDDYFKIGPRSPDEKKLTFIGFFNQHTVVEDETGHQANIILMSQPAENGKLPIIFDITATHMTSTDPNNFREMFNLIQSLRDLKNLIFRNTLKDACINLFQQ